MGQGAYVEYGKNLAFRHNLEVFSKESRPMVLLLVETMDAYEDYLIQHQRSSFGVAPVFRELNLSRGQRDHFFQLLMGKDIEIEDLHALSV